MKSKKAIIFSISSSVTIWLYFILNIVTDFSFIDIKLFGYIILFGLTVIIPIEIVGRVLQYKSIDKQKDILKEIDKMRNNINKLKETIN